MAAKVKIIRCACNVGSIHTLLTNQTEQKISPSSSKFAETDDGCNGSIVWPIIIITSKIQTPHCDPAHHIRRGPLCVCFRSIWALPLPLAPEDFSPVRSSPMEDGRRRCSKTDRRRWPAGPAPISSKDGAPINSSRGRQQSLLLSNVQRVSLSWCHEAGEWMAGHVQR